MLGFGKMLGETSKTSLLFLSVQEQKNNSIFYKYSQLSPCGHPDNMDSS